MSDRLQKSTNVSASDEALQDRIRPQGLENRLIDFAVLVIDVVEELPQTKAAAHIGGQLLRSGTAPAPNYAEARSAESSKDFSHKLKIGLKELRESLVWLKVLARKRFGAPQTIATATKECDELIAIFVSSCKTSERSALAQLQKSKIKNRQS